MKRKPAPSKSAFSRNLILLLVSITVAVVLYRMGFFHNIIRQTPQFRGLHAFIAGAFFTSIFTLPFSFSLLSELAETSPLKFLVPVAGLGAAFGDFLLLKAMGHDLIEREKDSLAKKFKKYHFSKIMHTKYFSWTMAFAGALVIASPLPDELGVGMLGLANLKTRDFLIISFLVNSLGIYLVATASEALF